MQYRTIHTRDGQWAVILPMDNDDASVVAYSPGFPKGRLELEFAEQGWSEADISHAIGAQHQMGLFNGALEDAVAEVKRQALEYAQ